MLSGLFTEAFFKRFGLLTIYSIFFLILVGGLVRVSGSGMGCPDWPKCFDQWVPPTDVSELPADYRERFAAPGKAVAEFSVFHTWTEYINRLIGALTGLFIVVCALSSLQFRKTDPLRTALSVLSLVLVGFQGWIGKVVVDTNLAEWMVTIHMLLALVIVALVMYVVYRNRITSERMNTSAMPVFKNLTLLAILFSLVQIGVGTQVREAIDSVLLRGAPGPWEEFADGLIKAHIFISAFVLGLSIQLYYLSKKHFGNVPEIMRINGWALVFTLVQIASGVANRWMDLNDVAQVVHITVGTIMFGAWFYSFLMINNEMKAAQQR